MKILMVNKFHYIKGGSETYYFALKRLLEANGHTVVDFSMEDEHNFPSPYSKYFVKNTDYANSPGIKEKLRVAGNIIYSREAKRKFRQLVVDTKPDLVHLHIFQHQLAPSMLDVCKELHIPTVYTAHDLKMVCLNYKMMHHGHICEDCKGGKLYSCAKNRCVKESFAKSCINVAEGYLHKLRHSYDAIHTIITPSNFYKEKMAQFGVAENRLVHIPNFLDKAPPAVTPREDREQYYLYFGRLSEEKGVLTLIKAFENTGLSLYIVGSGPIREQLEAYLQENNLSNIRLFGFLQGSELTDIVGNAKAVILPSEWYENGPYSAIEALQLGRPILGADIGGIPELVDGNGALFPHGDPEALRKAVLEIESLSEAAYRQLQQSSLTLFESQYTQAAHYPRLMEVYRKAME